MLCDKLHSYLTYNNRLLYASLGFFYTQLYIVSLCYSYFDCDGSMLIA